METAAKLADKQAVQEGINRARYQRIILNAGTSLSRMEKAGNYFEGLLQQDTSGFVNNLGKLVVNSASTQRADITHPLDPGGGFAYGAVVEGLWGNVTGIADIAKLGWSAIRFTVYQNPICIARTSPWRRRDQAR